MKKFNRLKRWIVAFLAGELVTLVKKDSNFQKGIKHTSGWEKIKYVLDSLFHFNKEIAQDVQQQIDFQQLKTQLNEWVDRVKVEYTALEKQLKELISDWTAIGGKIVTELTNRFQHLQESTEIVKQDLSSDFPLEKKMAELKKLIEDLAKKTKNS